MTSNPKKLKAFTLLEVLIATAIFAMVMIMSTGAISSSAGYQSKIKVTREVSDEATRLTDMLSRDLRAANGAFKAKLTQAAPVDEQKLFISGAAIVGSDLESFVGDSAGSTPPNILATNAFNGDNPALIIRAGDNFILYVGTGNKVYWRKISTTDLGSWYAGDVLILKIGSRNLFSEFAIKPDYEVSNSSRSVSSPLESTLNFVGYAPVESPTNQNYNNYQSFVVFVVHSETADFDNQKPTTHSQVDLRSMISLRNY